jgi:ABC-2 type transport system permease protein
MHAALALTRAGWQTARSYRVSMAVSIAWLALTIVPVYYVALALQPLMAASIQNEGNQYFAFVLLGTIIFSLLSTALTALPGAIGSGISSGFFEALLVTPSRLPSVLLGLVGYSYSWALVRAAVLLVAAGLFGANVMWWRIPEALVITALIMAAYSAVGLIAAAGVLAFRTTGYIPQAALVVSGLFGGVYYPTNVIASKMPALSAVSSVVPLAFGLRALRVVLLEDRSLMSVTDDLVPLSLYVVSLSSIGILAFAWALRYARRAGSLSQY